MKSSDHPTMVDSVLQTKAIGSVSNISADLSLPEGQDIQQLLEQHEKEKDQIHQEEVVAQQEAQEEQK